MTGCEGFFFLQKCNWNFCRLRKSANQLEGRIPALLDHIDGEGVAEMYKSAHCTALIWWPCQQTSAALFRCQEAPPYNTLLCCISWEPTDLNYKLLLDCAELQLTCTECWGDCRRWQCPAIGELHQEENFHFRQRAHVSSTDAPDDWDTHFRVKSIYYKNQVRPGIRPSH